MYLYIDIYTYIVTYMIMYICLHICSHEWKSKVKSTCFPVGQNNRCLQTNATLRIRWTFSIFQPKRVRSRKWGNTYLKWIWTVSKEVHNIYIYTYIDDIWVYIYMCICKPWKSETIKRNWYVSWVFWCLKRTCEICVCFFFRRKNAFTKNCRWDLRDVFVTSWILLVQTSIFTKHLPSRTNLPRSWCF